jgi:CHAT domain-containing protein/tetratricopeptide (TPR) repeat protein
MRAILFLLFCIRISFCFCQPNKDTLSLSGTISDTLIANEQMQRANQMMRERLFKEAGVYAQQAREIAEAAAGRQSIFTVRALVLEARAANGRQQYQMALDLLAQADEICRNLPGDNRINQASIALNTGIALEGKGAFLQAIEWKIRALDLYQTILPPTDRNIAVCANSLGLSYSSAKNHTKAIEYKTLALDIFIQISGDSSLDAAILHNNLGVDHWKNGNREQALNHHYKALAIRQKLLPSDHYLIGESYNNIGLVHEFSADLPRAIAAYEAAISVFSKKEAQYGYLVNSIYNNLGFVYHTMGQSLRGVVAKERALDAAISFFGHDHIQTAKTWGNLGSAYRNIGDYEKALTHFQSSIEITKRLGLPDHATNIFNLTSIGSIYLQLNNPQEAMTAFQAALDLNESVYPNDEKSLARCYFFLASGYFAQREWYKAIVYYQKCLDIRRRLFSPVHPILNDALIEMGNTYWELGHTDSARYHFQQALDILSLYSNKTHPVDPSSWLKAAAGLNSYYMQTFFRSQRIEKLYEIDNLVAKAQELLYDQRHQNPFPQDKYRLSKVAFPIFEAVIRANHLAQDNEKCLEYSEYIKGQQLYEMFKISHAENIVGISDSLIDAENLLAVQISYQEQLRHEKRLEGIAETDTIIGVINRRIFALHQEFLAHRQHIQSKYPEYYKLKYEVSPLPLDSIQIKVLKIGEALIEYFVGDSAIFVFVVRPDTFAVLEIPNDFALDSLVAQLRHGIYGYYEANKLPALYAPTAQQYTEAATTLYDKLIAPVQPLLPKRLYIVPDGVLGYVPFEALLLRADARADRFNEHHYFGKDHIISYAYSATLLREMRAKKHRKEPQGKVLAMAPFFRGDARQLSEAVASGEALLALRSDTLRALPDSGDEALRIAKAYKGKSLIGKEATKAAFEREASDYRILHLSTHGVADDRVGDYAWLGFAISGAQDQFEKLYVRDIYNLSLNADLVVLSACQAGLGKLQRGEGIISLSRAFAYAGAKGIVTTLWSVEDKKTKDFMLAFYGHLRKMPAAEALWQTRRDFLDKRTGEAAHPYFWAGFIGVGDL